MDIGITGHRTLDHTEIDLRKRIGNTLLRLKPEKVVCGMAIGFDQLVAEVCIELYIPLVAAIPFEGQENLWPEHVKNRFYRILLEAAEVKVISSGGYAPWKMFVRNHYIVDSTDMMLVYLREGEVKGGTAGCCAYARSKHKPIENLIA